MASSTTLSIVLKLVDEASGAMKGVANTFNTIDRGISENARTASQGFAIGMGAAVTAIGGLGYAALKAAGDMEQTQVAFTTMLGSGEKAQAFIQQLVQFAKTTPFTLTGLEDASKQLLAFGIAQERVIPDLTTLGNIAAGVGMDKLPNLILAFGQVSAKTRLMGDDLRQFTEAGIPLLQALVDQLNSGAIAVTNIGTASDKTSKSVQKLSDQNASLAKQLSLAQDQLEKQNNRLKEMVKNHNTASASYKNLRIDIQNTKDKIADLSGSIGTNTSKMDALGNASAAAGQKMSYTVANVQKMIEKGQISFDMVQQALESMTASGGRFNNLMQNQSLTLEGMISNLQDAWNIFLTGEGQKLLEWAKQFTTAAIYIVQNVLPVWIDKIQELIDWFAKHRLAIYVVAGAITGALVPAIWATVVAFGALAIALAPYIIGGALVGGLVAGIVWMVQNWDMLKQKINEFMERHQLLLTLFQALLPASSLIVGIIKGIVWMAQNWDMLKEKIDEVVSVFQHLIDIYNQVIALAAKPINFVINTITGKTTSGIGSSLVSTALKSFIPAFASGGIVTSPTLALIGEAGPEAVVPLSGTRSAGFGGITININGGVYLSEEAAQDIGDKIIRRLKLNLSF